MLNNSKFDWAMLINSMKYILIINPSLGWAWPSLAPACLCIYYSDCMSIQFWPAFKRRNRNVPLVSKEGLNCAGIISSSTVDVHVQVELIGLSLKFNSCTRLRWEEKHHLTFKWSFFTFPLSMRGSKWKTDIMSVIFIGQWIQFQGQKSKIFKQWSLSFFQDPDYPANKSLFAGLILQISCYLPE